MLIYSSVATCLAITSGAVVYMRQHYTPVTAETAQTITRSTDHPDETPVAKDAFTWKGDKNQPKYIDLPPISAGGYLQKVGTDQHNQIAVPSNIHFGGWFIGSARPGGSGLAVIVGHVNGRKSDDGIFKHLDKLVTGDRFSVELGSGQRIPYEVLSTKSYPTAEAINHLFSQDSSIRSQLNLITCSGTYNNQTHQYEKRTIVTARKL